MLVRSISLGFFFAIGWVLMDGVFGFGPVIQTALQYCILYSPPWNTLPISFSPSLGPEAFSFSLGCTFSFSVPCFLSTTSLFLPPFSFLPNLSLHPYMPVSKERCQCLQITWKSISSIIFFLCVAANFLRGWGLTMVLKTVFGWNGMVIFMDTRISTPGILRSTWLLQTGLLLVFGDLNNRWMD